MTSLVIEDLIENTDLDGEAMTALTGGYVSGFGWIRPFQRSVGSFGGPVVNQFFTLNQYVADNIQIINQEQNVNVIDSDGALINVDGNASNDLNQSLNGFV